MLGFAGQQIVTLAFSISRPSFLGLDHAADVAFPGSSVGPDKLGPGFGAPQALSKNCPKSMMVILVPSSINNRNTSMVTPFVLHVYFVRATIPDHFLSQCAIKVISIITLTGPLLVLHQR